MAVIFQLLSSCTCAVLGDGQSGVCGCVGDTHIYAYVCQQIGTRVTCYINTHSHGLAVMVFSFLCLGYIVSCHKFIQINRGINVWKCLATGFQKACSSPLGMLLLCAGLCLAWRAQVARGSSSPHQAGMPLESQ